MERAAINKIGQYLGHVRFYDNTDKSVPSKYVDAKSFTIYIAGITKESEMKKVAFEIRDAKKRANLKRGIVVHFVKDDAVIVCGKKRFGEILLSVKI